MSVQYEPLPLLLKYNTELNGYLYLTKYLNCRYNVNFNDLVEVKISTNENLDTSKILYYKNIYFIDFKKIKLIENENLFKFLNIILISNTKTKYQFIKFDFNIIILMNLNYINELYISKLTNIIENYQEYNNFIIFTSTEKIKQQSFHKLLTLSTVIHLNPFKEFNLKYTKNERQIFKLLGNNITKTELLIQLASNNSIKLNKLSASDLYDYICNNILIYNIINANLATMKIYDISFNLISMFSLKDIIICCNNIISYSTLNNLHNPYNLLQQDKLTELHSTSYNFDNNNTDLVKLKKFIHETKKIIDVSKSINASKIIDASKINNASNNIDMKKKN
jgi:hypothetical protein